MLAGQKNLLEAVMMGAWIKSKGLSKTWFLILILMHMWSGETLRRCRQEALWSVLSQELCYDYSSINSAKVVILLCYACQLSTTYLYTWASTMNRKDCFHKTLFKWPSKTKKSIKWREAWDLCSPLQPAKKVAFWYALLLCFCAMLSDSAMQHKK